MLTWPSRTHSLRLILAALFAPLIGICTVALLGAAIVAGFGDAGWPELPHSAASSSSFLILFGAPGAYLLEGLVGVPAYYWLTATGRFRASWVMLCAAGAGGLALSIPWTIAFGTWNPWECLSILAVGAAGGAVGGLAFWGIAYGTPRGALAA